MESKLKPGIVRKEAIDDEIGSSVSHGLCLPSKLRIDER